MACQLDSLGKCRNRVMLRNSLKSLPPTLDETYERILCAIRKEDSEYAIRILRWLAFSTRPLLVEEISQVVAINSERDPVFDRDEVLEDPQDALDICSSLITITESSAIEDLEYFIQIGKHNGDVVRLAHYSVKEYLTSDRIRQSRARQYTMRDTSCHNLLAHSCLGYLFQFEVSASDLPNVRYLKDFILAPYAINSWAAHVAATGETEKTGETGVSLSSRIGKYLLRDNRTPYPSECNSWST